MENINFERKKGVSIVSREAAEARRLYYLKKRHYWEQFEHKRGMHKLVKSTLLNLQELDKEFLVTPRSLERFFLLYLNQYHPSQQNLQRAVNMARVYALLSHQYYQSAEKYHMVASFFVSPSIWERWLIGRKAKESSIKLLKEMGLVISYRFNLNKHAPAEESRIVIMYQFVSQKVRWLHACVRTLIALEENPNKDGYSYCTYDDIMEDIFGYIEGTKNEDKDLF